MRTLPCAVLLAVAAAAQGAHPLLTDDSGTQGARRIQVELSAENSERPGPGEESWAQDGAATLSLGVVDAVDLSMGLPVTRIWGKGPAGTREASGLGDVSLALKWRFFEQGPLALALKPGLSLPSGDEGRGLGREQEGYDLLLIASLGGEGPRLHANAGWAPQARPAAGMRRELWRASLSAVAPLPSGWTLGLEAGLGQESDPAAVHTPAFATLGLAYAHTPRLDMDGGFRYSAAGEAFERRWMLGLSFRP